MLTRDLMRLMQDRVPFLQTIQGQTAFGMTISNLIQSYLPQFVNTEGITAFEQALYGVILQYAQLDHSPESMNEFQKQLSQLVQQHARTISTPQGQSLFERELASLIQRYSLAQQNEGTAANNPALNEMFSFMQLPKGKALEQDLTHFLQENLNILRASHQARQLEGELTRILSNKAQFFESLQGDTRLIQLAQLRGELTGFGLDSILKDVDKLLDRMRWMQFENVLPQSTHEKAQWLTLELPLALASGEMQQQKVQLRVAYQSKDKNRKIDPENTHIMLHFELGITDEVIDVDMAIVNKKVGAQIIVSNRALQPIAEDEMSGLADGLKELGYLLQTARCELARPKRVSLSEIQPTSAYPENPLGTINIVT